MMLEQKQLKACQQTIRTSAVMMFFVQMQGMILFMLCHYDGITRAFVT